MLSSDRPMCSILCSTGVVGVLASLAVTWMFLMVWKSIIPHLKEGNWGYLLLRNQDYCPTDSHFMIIFWAFVGSSKEVEHLCLLLCNLFKHTKLLYIRIKSTYTAFIWRMVACSLPIGYRVIEVVKLLFSPSYTPQITFRRAAFRIKLVSGYFSQGPKHGMTSLVSVINRIGSRLG